MGLLLPNLRLGTYKKYCFNYCNTTKKYTYVYIYVYIYIYIYISGGHRLIFLI